MACCIQDLPGLDRGHLLTTRFHSKRGEELYLDGTLDLLPTDRTWNDES
jgi:hypothetical protein